MHFLNLAQTDGTAFFLLPQTFVEEEEEEEVYTRPLTPDVLSGGPSWSGLYGPVLWLIFFSLSRTILEGIFRETDRPREKDDGSAAGARPMRQERDIVCQHVCPLRTACENLR